MNILSFRFSPDRKSLAAAVGDRSSNSIWIYDLARGVPTRLTTETVGSRTPVWSPDGKTIASTSKRKGHNDLYLRASNGSGADDLVFADGTEKIPTSWSPDGKFLLFHGLESVGIFALPVKADSTAAQQTPVLAIPKGVNGHFSPDGKLIAYVSSESGRVESFLTQFPPPPSGQGGKRQVSVAGGTGPRWREDGKEIFYLGLTRMLMAVDVSIGIGTVTVGQARTLFGPVGLSGYDVSADGQSFLVAVEPETKSAGTLTLVQNWTSALRK
jgi:hypothetical protein